jgi:hypothetical protein
MVKTAIKTTKKVSKVSTAKGKGKPALAKTKGDLKKPLKKVVTKKVAKVTVSKAVIAKKIAKANKPVVKRAPKTVDPNKYGKFIIEDCPNDKYPEMVIITVAPKMYDDFIGRKYVNRDRCITTIESVRTGDSIDKGAKSVIKELDSIGLAPLEPADTDLK